MVQRLQWGAADSVCGDSWSNVNIATLKKTRDSYHWVERRRRSSFTSLVEALRWSLASASQSYHLASSNHSGCGWNDVRNFVISSGAPGLPVFGVLLSVKAYTVGFPVPAASTWEPHSKFPTSPRSRGPSKASRKVAQERLMRITIFVCFESKRSNIWGD